MWSNPPKARICSEITMRGGTPRKNFWRRWIKNTHERQIKMLLSYNRFMGAVSAADRSLVCLRKKLAVEDGVGTTCTCTLCSFEAITYSYKCLGETQKVIQGHSTATKPPLTHNKFFGARLLHSFFWCCWATCTGFYAIRLKPELSFCIKAMQNLSSKVHVIADPTQYLIA